MKRNDGRSKTMQRMSKEGRAARSKNYTLAELEALPTLSTAQADDLKVDTGDVRVWLSRCTTGDGEPFNNAVTVEVFNIRQEKWLTFRRYEAK